VSKHFLVGLDEAADTDKVIYHSQVLVDRVTELTGYHTYRHNNVVEYGMPQDSDDERKASLPFDAKIVLKVNEFKRLLER
jgi:hypothetical protein